jgi:hypothetical protein
VSSEDPTPTRPSKTVHVFREACEEMLRDLDAALQPDVRGRDLRHECAELLTVMQHWGTAMPSDEERRATIGKVTSLHRRVKEYLSVRRGG